MSALSSLAAMVVQPMLVDDAPALVRIATSWGNRFMASADAAGFVVRDGDDVVAFATLRETGQGGRLLVIDDLWPERSKRGRIALGVLANYLEAFAQAQADARGEPVHLGGIVLLTHLAHDLALEKRGFGIVGHVRSKEYAPR